MTLENQEKRDAALSRAETLLDAAARFIARNSLDEYCVHYDEAECDGYCLRQDIQYAIEDIRELAAVDVAKEE